MNIKGGRKVAFFNEKCEIRNAKWGIENCRKIAIFAE